MSIVSEIKCARCDRMYSGVRSRCPYCGARRIGRGKYSEESDNSRGKMLVGILILAVLVIAVAVLLFTTPDPDVSAGQVVKTTETGLPSESHSVPGESENVVETGTHVVEPPPTTSGGENEDPITDSPSPNTQMTAIESVKITYSGTLAKDFTITINERVPLSVKYEPAGADVEIEWTSSNTDVFRIEKVKNSIDGSKIECVGVGIGDAKVIVRVNDVESTCIVRGRKK